MHWDDYTGKAYWWQRTWKGSVPSETCRGCRKQLCTVSAWKIYLEEDTKNIPAAIQYLTLAAKQKNEFAAYRLGKIYLAGEELPKNTELALHYLKMAADTGNQYAQYALGKVYLIGKDARQDKERAYDYF